METELYLCFCGESLKKAKFLRHTQLCPTYRAKKEELRLKAIELKKKRMTRKQIAEALTASLDPSSGVIISSNFVKGCFRKPKQKEAKATPAAKTTEQKLTLEGFLEKLDDLTFWEKLLKSGLLDKQMKVFVGHLLDQIISLKKQIQDNQETIRSLEKKNENTEAEKVVLCQKNKELSRGMELLVCQLNAQRKEENAALIAKCRKAMAEPGEGSLVGKGS